MHKQINRYIFFILKKVIDKNYNYIEWSLLKFLYSPIQVVYSYYNIILLRANVFLKIMIKRYVAQKYVPILVQWPIYFIAMIHTLNCSNSQKLWLLILILYTSCTVVQMRNNIINLHRAL